MGELTIIPITFRKAKAFVAENHRHSKPPQGHKFSIGLELAGELVGVVSSNFLMNAFKYGAPPHGGMAFGFDRLIMLLANSKQIRDVIAFPKTTSAMSLMDNSPSKVDIVQLEELGLKIKPENK